MGEEADRKSTVRYTQFEQVVLNRSSNLYEKHPEWSRETRKMIRFLKWLLLPVALTYVTIHEGAHIVTATLQGEKVLGVQIYGPGIKVLLATPENARQGIKWGFIAVSGIAFTLTTGYILYLLRSRWFGIRNAYLRHFFLYSLVVLLCGDPFYYVCYPILGTGDIVGVSSFFGVPIALVYLIALSLLALNIYLARYRVGSEMKAMGLLHQP